jgi:Fe-S cluster assembly protein SufD
VTPLEEHLAQHARFTEERPAGEPAWLQALRKGALARFAELGFPTPQSEAWRYTNVSAIAQTTFQLAPHGEQPSRAVLEELAVPVFACSLFVFVNGRFAPELSSLRGPLSAPHVESLADVLAHSPARVEPHLGRHASSDEHAFVALNTAFLADGAWVEIPERLACASPIHIVHLSLPGGPASASHPRTLIVAGAGSRASVIEDYVSLGAGTRLTNAVTEVVVGAQAQLEHVRLQRETQGVFHIGHLQARQERDSRFASHVISLGASLARQELGVLLADAGTECLLHGLYAGADHQHLDHQTTVDHAQPHGTSRELYKGVLAGAARGVFNGRVIVRPDAQHTSARQSNKNLLLSRDAEVNSKPQLEIAADDVQCSHGSTIGSLDEDALYYLRTRGLGEHEARAFASEIVSQIGIEPLRPCIEELLVARLAQALPAGEAA